MTHQAGHAGQNRRTLSDEYWMLSHHDYDGKTLVDEEVLETGLAGAVLAELLLAGRLDIIDKRVVVRDLRPTGNPLLDLVVSMVANTPTKLTPLKWIQNIRDAQYSSPERSGPISLTDTVGLRLAAAGLVEEQVVRGLFRTGTRLVPAAWTRAAAPAVRIGYYLGRLNEMDTETRLLAGLALAVGLDGQIGAGYPLPVRPAIEAASEQLHPHPVGHEVLSTLLNAVDKAVAAVAMRIRR
jgi:hypothetical protein